MKNNFLVYSPSGKKRYNLLLANRYDEGGEEITQSAGTGVNAANIVGALGLGAGMVGSFAQNLKAGKVDSTTPTGWTKQALLDWSGSVPYQNDLNNWWKSGLEGGITGAAAGTMVNPGMGSIIGGAAGLVGGIGTALFGNSKKRRQNRAINKMLPGKVAAQNMAINQDGVNDFLNATYGRGGKLMAYGGDFSTGVSKIGNGGSHEENVLGGIPVSIGENGEPNLVEEGEVKWNNYIFSNRLSMAKDKEEAELLGIPKGYQGLPFSKVAVRMAREAEERENDPISKRGMDNMLSRLAMAQEIERATLQGGNDGGNVFARGGIEPIKKMDFGVNPYLTRVEPQMQYRDYNGNPVDEMPSAPAYNRTTTDWTWANNLWNNGESLRYAPILANAGLGLEAMLSKPDKLSLERVEAPVVTERMQYNPYDTEYMAGMMRQQANATNRRLADSAGGNAGVASALMLANNRNTQEGLSAAMMQAAQLNDARRAQALQFNAGIQQANTQMAWAAKMANLQQSNTEKDYNAKSKVARTNAIRQALATIGTQAGNIGTENHWKDVAKTTQGYDWKGLFALLNQNKRVD
jgi:hypothetical protein